MEIDHVTFFVFVFECWVPLDSFRTISCLENEFIWCSIFQIIFWYFVKVDAIIFQLVLLDLIKLSKIIFVFILFLYLSLKVILLFHCGILLICRLPLVCSRFRSSFPTNGTVGNRAENISNDSFFRREGIQGLLKIVGLTSNVSDYFESLLAEIGVRWTWEDFVFILFL